LISDGINFNNKHSYYDFGLILQERKIGNPSKIKNTERVPWSNIEYDFSNLYSEQEYEERAISYTFALVAHSKQYYTTMKTVVVNWLCSAIGKTVLKDDIIPNYYFLAEVVKGPSETDFNSDGSITVEFTAYPFKISSLKEGHDIWDEFNFLLDYAQETDFTVNGSLEITLHNPGITIVYPKITCSSSMKLQKENITYEISAGSTSSYDFSLSPGENKLKILGIGTISFEFYKELI